MPRKSLRRTVLEELHRSIKRRKLAAFERFVNEDEDSLDDADDNIIQTLIDQSLVTAYETIDSQRYLLPRQPYRQSVPEMFVRDLDDTTTVQGIPSWLSDDEFLEKYRVHRESFYLLLSRIKDHPVFQNTVGKKPQAPVAHQLMVYLFYLGTSGSGASNPRLRSMFVCGRGTAEVYKRRCCKAIRSLKGIAIIWPNEEEQKEISKRIFTNYNILNCIAIADGTLFPLSYEPQSEDAPDFQDVSLHILCLS
jgi:hypothetical protein